MLSTPIHFLTSSKRNRIMYSHNTLFQNRQMTSVLHFQCFTAQDGVILCESQITDELILTHMGQSSFSTALTPHEGLKPKPTLSESDLPQGHYTQRSEFTIYSHVTQRVASLLICEPDDVRV